MRYPAAMDAAAPPPPAPSGPPSAAVLAVLLAQIGFGMVAMTICLPSMQAWQTAFSAAPASVQATFGAYVLAFGSMQLLHGPLSDRHGRRLVLLAGIALAALGSLLAALAQDLWSLVAARAVQGAGASAGMVVGRALVNDLYQGSARTRVMAYVGMAMGLCPPIATFVGGLVHVQLGWRANFLIVVLLAVWLAVAAWRLLPATSGRSDPGSHWFGALTQAYRRLLREPRFVLHATVLAMTQAVYFVYLGGVPLALPGYGLGPQDVGWFVLCSSGAYICGNFLTSRLSHRLGEATMLNWGQAVSVAGIVAMVGLGHLPTPLALALPMLLVGVGHGLLVPPALVGTVSVIPALAGAAAGLAGVTQQATSALATLVVGLVPHEGARNVGLLMGGFALCAVAAQLALHRSQRRASAAS